MGFQCFLFFYTKNTLTYANVSPHIDSVRSNVSSSPCAVSHEFSSVVSIKTVSAFTLFVTDVRSVLYLLYYFYSKLVYLIIPIYYY